MPELGKTRYNLGDVVQMRKVHPCGSDRWEILRVGMDFKIKCLGCGRVVMLPRPKFERGVEAVVSAAASGAGNEPTGPEEN